MRTSLNPKQLLVWTQVNRYLGGPVDFSGLRASLDANFDNLVKGRRVHVLAKVAERGAVSHVYLAIDGQKDKIWLVFTYPLRPYMENRTIGIDLQSLTQSKEDINALRLVAPMLEKGIIKGTGTKQAFYQIIKMLGGSTQTNIKLNRTLIKRAVGVIFGKSTVYLERLPPFSREIAEKVLQEKKSVQLSVREDGMLGGLDYDYSNVARALREKEIKELHFSVASNISFPNQAQLRALLAKSTRVAIRELASNGLPWFEKSCPIKEVSARGLHISMKMAVIIRAQGQSGAQIRFEAVTLSRD